MSLPFRFHRSCLSGRMASAAALLIALFATEVCSAAEMTFSGNYSVQLPAGWKADAQEDKSVIGQGPDGVSFGFKAYPSDISPEDYMEKALGNTEKRPGYKLIEKGAVKSGAGRKAHLLRYELDSPKGREVVAKYYFQLVEKQVVVLLFSWLSGVPTKSPKSDIEAIFDSVKVGPASSQDDSWLTTPEEKSKESSKATGGAPPAPTGPKTSASLVTFATNCSVELPAGWTGKASGKHIEATGPGGMRLDGFSEKSPMSVDLALAVHLDVLQKMPGYELVDTDEISTKAGAKGKLSYYRYNGKNGPVAEVGVIIEVAKNQIATLRFLVPSASRKLDASFQDAVEAIFSSLKISQ